MGDRLVAMTRKYKILIALVLVVVVLAALFHGFVIRPKFHDVQYDEEIVVQNQERMLRRGWPTHAASLEQRLARERQEMVGLRRRAGELMQRLNNTFADEIREGFEDADKFMTHASRLDYQELFAELADQFRRRGVVVTPESLALDEGSPVVYPLIIQLWMLRDLVTLTTEADLQFTRDLNLVADAEEVSGNRRDAPAFSNIAFKQVAAYANDDPATGDRTKPFLLEFPVRLKVRGSVQDVARFIQHLQSSDRLYSTNRIEIKTVPPSPNQPSTSTVDASLECSAFFLMQQDLGALGL